ncbi:MAG: hypothetical protein R6X02_33955 [Enhygromyxa sp.]
MSTAPHPWMLTGPWYRWDPAGVPEAGRSSKPEIQKYAGFEFAAEFLREPQRYVVCQDEDYFHRTVLNGRVLPANLDQLLTQSQLSAALKIVDKTSNLSLTEQRNFIDAHFGFTDTDRAKDVLVNSGSPHYLASVDERREWVLGQLVADPTWRAAMGTWLREKTSIRKLYKPTHARNYLVVVELHCDAPGLPSVPREEVAEAGFVVRRLEGRVDDPELANKATKALQKLALARDQVQYLERNARGRIRSASGLVSQRRLERPVLAKQNQLLDEWAAGTLALDELAAAGAFGLDTQAWIPDELDPLRGRWQTITDATPRTELAGEAFVPLYPLIPDPRESVHTAAGRTVYFGVIPTGGREAEADGAPQLDDRHLYEIRCFVRRKPHKPGCPGELVWSEPSVGYRLAADADPEGTANLPISISVPSMRDVQAFADRLTTGGAGGVRIVQPPDSVMPLKGDFPDLEPGDKSGIGQICFIAILLLFMIALFLMFAFLPIIVFLFQLFFLLRLKFCIPPAIDLKLEVAAKVKAELDVQFAVGAEIGVDAKFAIGGDFQDQFLLENGIPLEAWANAALAAAYGDSPDLLTKLMKLSLEAKVQRVLDLGTDFRGSIDPELAGELNFGNWPSSADAKPAPPPGSDMAPPLPVGGGKKLQYHVPLDPREVFA